MRRPLRKGDVVVADANVVNDFLSEFGIARRDPKSSLRLLAAVRSCEVEILAPDALLERIEPSQSSLGGREFLLLPRLAGAVEGPFEQERASEFVERGHGDGDGGQSGERGKAVADRG